MEGNNRCWNKYRVKGFLFEKKILFGFLYKVISKVSVNI